MGEDAGLAWAIRNEAKIERVLTQSHRRISVVVGPHAGVGLRLDRFLALALPRISRSLIQRWLNAGYARRGDNEIVSPKHRIKAGDRFEMLCPLPPGILDIDDEPPPLEVLYDQGGVVVVNKPPGLLAHQAGKHLSGTLLNQLQDVAEARGLDVRDARLVNRIDRDTSGIVLASLNEDVHRSLSNALQGGHLRKEYRAICTGMPEPLHGHWRQAIRDDPTGASIARQLHPSGQISHTEYEVVEATPSNSHALLHIVLHTGRQHQIRIHAAGNGHPLVGDWTYGPPCAELLGQALHAARLSFPEPHSGDEVVIEAPLTGAIARLWSHLRAGGELTPRERNADENRRLDLCPQDAIDEFLPEGWRRPTWLGDEELRELAEATGEWDDEPDA
ncbi:MAG: RluA family pseudouridine synthase [Planctomycetota bacterium]|jgi:23S rRNA pseudouridine1911/1915/1917 synthase|nr:RluA family pseudouridine synthase [Planctomycetota bacterium]